MKDQVLSAKSTSFGQRVVNLFAMIFLIIILVLIPRTIAVAGIFYFKYKTSEKSQPNEAIIAVLAIVAFALDLIIYSKIIQ